MGKIRLKVVGDEALEQEQKDEQKKRRMGKASREAGSAFGGKKAKVAGVGLGGGERINAVGVSEEEIEKELEQGPKAKTAESAEQTQPEKEAKKSKKKAKEKVRSKRYTESVSHIAKKTNYPVEDGIEILRKFKKGKFDETVELHVNTREKGLSGQVQLPHGTGKKLRIKIADDALIEQVEKGKIDFDILVAEPLMMPKLAKVARVLGPRGLMPNPKNGTISDKPQEVVEKLSAGQVSFKTEAEAPIIHMSVGKLSFDDKKLSENIKTALSAIDSAKIANVTLKSTMSPGIRLQV